MKKAIIYIPTRNLMQSGNSTSNIWKLVFNKETDNKQESLMGWASTFETQNQVVLKFKSKDDAVNYAQKNGLAFEVIEPEHLKNETKDITFNFSKDRNLYYF